MEVEANCVSCQRPDAEENMVQCDHCDKWQHYSCAGVDESVADRPWMCGYCTASQRKDDMGSFRSVSSRSSETSAFSVCLSQLVQKQQAERARVELALQRRHLDEQQKLIDEVLGETAGSHCGEKALERRTQVARLATRSVPGTSVAGVRRSKSEATALIELRNRVEQCERRAKPTPEQLSAVRTQLEVCRNLLVGIQPDEGAGEYSQRLPQQAASQSHVEMRSGTTPKTSRMESEAQYLRPNQHAAAETAVNHGLVGQKGLILVSQPNAATETYANSIYPSGKRQAFHDNANHSTCYCPTTNKFEFTREQPRFDARPGEKHASHDNYNEQQRSSFARSGDMNVRNERYCQLESSATGEHTRAINSRSVDSYLPPRLSETVQQAQVIPPSVLPPTVQDSVPTQRQLAARQSLAKELPRFSGDPADWPIFISNFYYTTEACGFSNGENMLRLQRCLTGPALETVRSRLVLPTAVPQVIETLRMRFGRPELLINALLRKVREIPAPRSDRLEGLIDFGMAVQALCDHIEAANERAHLSNPSLLQELVMKLPADQRMMWAGYKRGLQHVDLKTFGDYMASVVQDATSVVSFEPEVRRSNARERPKNKGFVNAHTTDSHEISEATPKLFDCLHCKRSGHRVRECVAFKEMGVDDRWRRVRALQLCQNCLYNHGRRACRGRKTCDIDGCQFRHHPLLHSARGPPNPSVSRLLVA